MNNQYAILICNNLSIECKYPSVSHVSPNGEDGINFKPTKRNMHKSIKGLQVQHIMSYVLQIFELQFKILKSCLVIHVISISSVSTDVCFFLRKSQYVSTSKMCVSIDVHLFCASFCVSKVKNSQKLCQTYTLVPTLDILFTIIKVM